MFVTINRFVLKAIATEQFEAIWNDQSLKMLDISGFISLTILRDTESTEDRILYAIEARWHSREDLMAWVRSPSFEEAHRDIPDLTDLYIEKPIVSRYEVVTHNGH